METNLNGTLRACQIFGATMVRAGYGRIVNIASLSSFVGFYQVAAYSASKAAVASLTRCWPSNWRKRRERECDRARSLSHAAECFAD